MIINDLRNDLFTMLIQFCGTDSLIHWLKKRRFDDALVWLTGLVVEDFPKQSVFFDWKSAKFSRRNVNLTRAHFSYRNSRSSSTLHTRLAELRKSMLKKKRAVFKAYLCRYNKTPLTTHSSVPDEVYVHHSYGSWVSRVEISGEFLRSPFYFCLAALWFGIPEAHNVWVLAWQNPVHPEKKTS